jgi:membrane protein YqaA with SNARE-associated domain
VIDLLSSIENWLLDLVLQFGYLGVFLISCIGAATIIFPIPYTLTLFWLGAFSDMDILLLTLSSGIGSALGELIGYILGYAANNIINESRKEKFKSISKFITHKKYWTPLLIFAFALTPLPDDLLFIPLGIIRYSVWKALIPAIAGKILMSYILVYSGRVYNQFIFSLLGESGGIISIIVTTILMIIVMTLMWKIDWEKILKINQKKE